MPPPALPEVAFAGRANVGKSSLINKLLGAGKLALTSSKPGKTRTLNFFRIDHDCYFVDLPGYGYSRVSKQEQARWRGLIEGYLLDRETLRLLVLIMDARHGPQPNDLRMREWTEANGLPHLAVLTKADKLRPGRLRSEKRRLTGAADWLGRALFFSAVSGMGKKEVWRAINSAVYGS